MRRRKFSRSQGRRPYRKLFIIATEGEKTEPRYFSFFNDPRSVIRVKCLKGSKGKHHSDPRHVLKRMERYIKDESLKASDEA
uniref:RloB-like protein n=1 Tax=Candidatus Kentrum sp. FW TaxID=2126338 RepID=A0A450TQ11_9GAMM|nr:MAG: RloB-like protein [Candidatus Kentron sp. FW]